MLLRLILLTILARSCLFSTQKGQNAITTGFLCYVGLVYFYPQRGYNATNTGFIMLSWSCLFLSPERLQRYQEFCVTLTLSMLSSEGLECYQDWLSVLRRSFPFTPQRSYNATKNSVLHRSCLFVSSERLQLYRYWFYVGLVYFILREATTLPLLALYVTLVLSIFFL